MSDTVKRASDLMKAADAQAEKMATDEGNLQRGYAQLGFMLLEVSEMQYWRITFDSFLQYLEYISKISKKSVGHLRQYFLAVRDLNDVFTQEELENIGITKAVKLRKARDYAIVFPKNIIDAALNPDVTANELQKIIGVALNVPKDEEPGDWFEVGFIVSPEEKKLIDDTFYVMRRVDPITKDTLDESAQAKDVFLKMCFECFGTYAGNLPDDGGANR